MIVLHGGWMEGRLWLWGEQAPQETPSDRRRGRKRASRSPARSPYDADAGTLVAGLALAAPARPARPGDVSLLVVWRPTAPDGIPAASDALVAEPPAPGALASNAPWSVSALPLDAGQAVDLLCACVDRDTLGPGVVVGTTLRYWSAALRLAGALVAREAFVPALSEDDGAFRAVWEPAPQGPDSERMGRLAAAMPSACRALSRSAEAAPEVPAAQVLTAFVAAACDHLVRLACQADQAEASRPGRRRSPAFASLHDHWVHALRAADGRMAGDAAALRDFAAQVREWRRPVRMTASAPFRLVFRLEEPALVSEDERAPDAGAWTVRYLLQAADDPSLLVPAEAAWRGADAEPALARRGDFNAREVLLAALGSASRVSPGVEQSLRGAAPAGYETDTAGAHRFLTEDAWMLEQAGFGVLLPAWWGRRGARLRLAARGSVKAPSMQARAGLSLDTIVEVDWEVALGGQALSLLELEELARAKVPLVRLRGQWVALSADEIEAAIAFWRRRGTQRMTAGDALRAALGAGDALGDLEVESVAATGWMGELVARLTDGAGLEEVPPPAGLQGELRPYQRRGFSWLDFLRTWGLGACLADDMGLGKTVQVLALLQRQREHGETRPTLVVCPTSVVGNWAREAARFAPGLPVMVHHGLTRSRGPAFCEAAGRHAVVLSSYALLHRDREFLEKVPWASIVLDEAQNIKNPETKQARAARSLPADFRIALTGTPVENHVGDLWSIMEFLNPGLLGTQSRFRRTFFVPIQANRDPDAAHRLKRLTGPFILRREKTDRTVIADLPEKLEMKVFCTLTPEQASLYRAVAKEAEEGLGDAEGIQRKGLVLATLARLKQVCNHPAQFLADNSPIAGRSGKLARLTEMLEEALAEGDRALIFTQYAEMGHIIRRHLEETFGRECLFLHGAVPKPRRDAMVERFQSADGGPPLFILSLKAGGTGLNLTAANRVFHFDRWWNPAVENQATDRAFRIGQKKNVQVHKFVCAGTLEEKIDEMIEAKRAVAAQVVGTGEGWLTELSTAQLKELFTLRRDAVEG